MTQDTDRVALELVLRTLPTKRGVVLMLDEQGQIETGALGMTDQDVMLACWSVAVSIASQTPEGQEVFQKVLRETMTGGSESRPRLYIAKGIIDAEG